MLSNSAPERVVRDELESFYRNEGGSNALPFEWVLQYPHNTVIRRDCRYFYDKLFGQRDVQKGGELEAGLYSYQLYAEPVVKRVIQDRVSASVIEIPRKNLAPENEALGICPFAMGFESCFSRTLNALFYDAQAEAARRGESVHFAISMTALAAPTKFEWIDVVRYRAGWNNRYRLREWRDPKTRDEDRYDHMFTVATEFDDELRWLLHRPVVEFNQSTTQPQSKPAPWVDMALLSGDQDGCLQTLASIIEPPLDGASSAGSPADRYMNFTYQALQSLKLQQWNVGKLINLPDSTKPCVDDPEAALPAFPPDYRTTDLQGLRQRWYADGGSDVAPSKAMALVEDSIVNPLPQPRRLSARTATAETACFREAKAESKAEPDTLGVPAETEHKMRVAPVRTTLRREGSVKPPTVRDKAVETASKSLARQQLDACTDFFNACKKELYKSSRSNETSTPNTSRQATLQQPCADHVADASLMLLAQRAIVRAAEALEPDLAGGGGYSENGIYHLPILGFYTVEGAEAGKRVEYPPPCANQEESEARVYLEQAAAFQAQLDEFVDPSWVPTSRVPEIPSAEKLGLAKSIVSSGLNDPENRHRTLVALHAALTEAIWITKNGVPYCRYAQDDFIPLSWLPIPNTPSSKFPSTSPKLSQATLGNPLFAAYSRLYHYIVGRQDPHDRLPFRFSVELTWQTAGASRATSGSYHSAIVHFISMPTEFGTSSFGRLGYSGLTRFIHPDLSLIKADRELRLFRQFASKLQKPLPLKADRPRSYANEILDRPRHRLIDQPAVHISDSGSETSSDHSMRSPGYGLPSAHARTEALKLLAYQNHVLRGLGSLYTRAFDVFAWKLYTQLRPQPTVRRGESWSDEECAAFKDRLFASISLESTLSRPPLIQLTPEVAQILSPFPILSHRPHVRPSFRVNYHERSPSGKIRSSARRDFVDLLFEPTALRGFKYTRAGLAPDDATVSSASQSSYPPYFAPPYFLRRRAFYALAVSDSPWQICDQRTFLDLVDPMSVIFEPLLRYPDRHTGCLIVQSSNTPAACSPDPPGETATILSRIRGARYKLMSDLGYGFATLSQPSVGMLLRQMNIAYVTFHTELLRVVYSIRLPLSGHTAIPAHLARESTESGVGLSSSSTKTSMAQGLLQLMESASSQKAQVDVAMSTLGKLLRLADQTILFMESLAFWKDLYVPGAWSNASDAAMLAHSSVWKSHQARGRYDRLRVPSGNVGTDMVVLGFPITSSGLNHDPKYDLYTADTVPDGFDLNDELPEGLSGDLEELAGAERLPTDRDLGAQMRFVLPDTVRSTPDTWFWCLFDKNMQRMYDQTIQEAAENVPTFSGPPELSDFNVPCFRPVFIEGQAAPEMYAAYPAATKVPEPSIKSQVAQAIRIRLCLTRTFNEMDRLATLGFPMGYRHRPVYPSPIAVAAPLISTLRHIPILNAPKYLPRLAEAWMLQREASFHPPSLALIIKDDLPESLIEGLWQLIRTPKSGKVKKAVFGRQVVDDLFLLQDYQLLLRRIRDEWDDPTVTHQRKVILDNYGVEPGGRNMIEIVQPMLYLRLLTLYILTNLEYPHYDPALLVRQVADVGFVRIPHLCLVTTVFSFAKAYADQARAMGSRRIPTIASIESPEKIFTILISLAREPCSASWARFINDIRKFVSPKTPTVAKTHWLKSLTTTSEDIAAASMRSKYMHEFLPTGDCVAIVGLPLRRKVAQSQRKRAVSRGSFEFAPPSIQLSEAHEFGMAETEVEEELKISTSTPSSSQGSQVSDDKWIDRIFQIWDSFAHATSTKRCTLMTSTVPEGNPALQTQNSGFTTVYDIMEPKDSLASAEVVTNPEKSPAELLGSDEIENMLCRASLGSSYSTGRKTQLTRSDFLPSATTMATPDRILEGLDDLQYQLLTSDVDTMDMGFVRVDSGPVGRSRGGSDGEKTHRDPVAKQMASSVAQLHDDNWQLKPCDNSMDPTLVSHTMRNVQQSDWANLVAVKLAAIENQMYL